MNARGNQEGAVALYQRVDALYKSRLAATHPYRLFVEQQLTALVASHSTQSAPTPKSLR